MENKLKNILEKFSPFYGNLFFVLFFLIVTYQEISFKIFFFTSIFLCFIFGYFLFNISKKVCKDFITSSLLLIFLMSASNFLIISEIFKIKTTPFSIIIYNLVLIIFFLIFAEIEKNLIFNFKSISFKKIISIFIMGSFFGILFYIVGEHTLNFLIAEKTFFFLKSIIFIFLLVLSEQLLFTVFLYNIYNSKSSKNLSTLYSATIFTLFHFIALKNLVQIYFIKFGSNSFIFLSFYFLLLFIFMCICAHIYSSNKNSQKIFLYPLFFHFFVNIVIFLCLNLF